jgi:Protein of unknown function (DUF1203)
MIPIRVIAIPTEIAEAVRRTGKDPQYGHPAHTEIAGEGAPCRHCLKIIAAHEEKATLFTLDAFAGTETLPLPGPVYIHANQCERYPEDAGFPAMLRNSPRTLNAYARGRRLVATEYVHNGNVDAGVQKLLAREDVDYIQVRSTTAGCYTFRIERAEAGAHEVKGGAISCSARAAINVLMQSSQRKARRGRRETAPRIRQPREITSARAGCACSRRRSSTGAHTIQA